MATTILPELTKRIAFNRTTKGYDCYISIDGDLEHYIGSAPTYPEAERTCRDYAYNFYSDTNTPEKAVQVALADEPIAAITVTRCWGDQDKHPDTPPESASVWTDYKAGCVVIGIGESDYVNDILIFGVQMEVERATLAALTQVHTDLGYLLADARVRAALNPGAALPTELPPTQMVRVRGFKAACSFPLALSLNVGCAISRERHRIGLTEHQMYDVMILAAQVIEDMFDLTVGLGILGSDTNKLADAAYQQGFQKEL